MKPVQRKSLTAISAASLVLALVACDRADDRTAAAHESGTTRTEQAANTSRDDTRPAREAARATTSAEAAMDRAAQDTRAMGAAAATRIDDASITAKVNAALAADKELGAIGIDVDTRDAIVTLSGPIPTASAKERAAEVAHRIKGVESVNNQLTIKAG